MGRFDEENEEGKGYRIAISGLKAAIRIMLLVLVVIFVVFAARKVYAVGYEAFSTRALDRTEEKAVKAEVSITKDMSVRDIGAKLKELGLIRMSEDAFVVQAEAYGYANNIKPGRYKLNSAMTPSQMLEAMTVLEEEDDS